MTTNPQYKARLNHMLRTAKAEGRELRLSDIPGEDFKRWVAAKLALEKKPKLKVPGRKKR